MIFNQSGFSGKPPNFVTHLLSQTLHILQRDLIWAESEYTPARESCGEVFLTRLPPHGLRALRVPLRGIHLASRQSARFQIGIESSSAVVATIDPNTALDLDQHTGLHMREISPPTTLGIEARGFVYAST